MSANQAGFPPAGSRFDFKQHGKPCWVSWLLPHPAKVVDDLCLVKWLWTEEINHHAAMTFFQTGPQIPGRPSPDAWISYGPGFDGR